MQIFHRDPGSFRDPSGHVFFDGDRVLRTINPVGVENFKAVADTGLLEELTEVGLVIPTKILSPDDVDLKGLVSPRGVEPSILLEHPRIPLITYPYEWTFSQLKDAALAHLDLQILAIDKDVVLTDATPYNMQFYGGDILHIDVLSMRPYRDGEYWAGYNQFCRLFLVPLLLEAWCGVPFQPLLRGTIDGISLSDAARLLPKSKLYLTINGLLHITGHARSVQANSSSTSSASAAAVRAMPKNRYRAMLSELRHWINRLQSKRSSKTFWHDYADSNSYSTQMQEDKRQFVSKFVRKSGARTIWDLGGNTGDYSVACLDAGVEQATILDSDLDSLEKAYARRKAGRPELLPIVMDCADQSPDMGWNQQERKGLNERANPEAVLALAVVHHMCIGRNIPLASALDWIVGLAPSGVIEFVPKSDPMVTQMLQFRDDVFNDYDEEHFRAYMSQKTRLIDEQHFEGNNRLLVHFERL